MLSITWMDDIDEPGWYVGVMLGELWGGCTLPQEGKTLHGDLNAWDESAEPFVVTISEEGEDGLLLEIEGGESYHFTPAEMQEATIITTVNTEGFGNIATGEGESTPEIPRRSIWLIRPYTPLSPGRKPAACSSSGRRTARTSPPTRRSPSGWTRAPTLSRCLKRTPTGRTPS